MFWRPGKPEGEFLAKKEKEKECVGKLENKL